MKLLQKFDLLGFLSNVLSVILGIIITFAIQDRMDERKTKSDMRSALELVADELRTCRSDLQDCAGTMEEEMRGAAYFLSHAGELSRCPQDTVNRYGLRLVNVSVLTMSYEAVDLLKSNASFQAIGDDDLSLSILRGYDICKAIQQIFNDHEDAKKPLFSKAARTDKVPESGPLSSFLDYEKMLRDEEARAILVSLRVTGPETITMGLPLIDETIEKIGRFLER